MKNLLPALLSLLFTGLFQSLQAQRMEIPAQFGDLLDRAGVEFFQPLDAGYRDFTPPKNEHHNCHFAIRSAREKLDMLFYIIPWDDQDPQTTNPHVRTFTTLTGVADNADDLLISAIQPASEKLSVDFNADWGMIYFFKPKPDFSDRQHCRMVSLCREGQGTVFVFYLFDDAGNEALDLRYLTLRFE